MRECDSDLSLFFDILFTLEDIGVPYMIIGAFAGAIYGVTRLTYDIDIPLTMTSRYLRAFQNRVQQTVDTPTGRAFTVWCAQPEDVIIGKLMAWAEGRSRKHETDIYEMLVFHYLNIDPELSVAFNEGYVDQETERLGKDVGEFWQITKVKAHAEAERQRR